MVPLLELPILFNKRRDRLLPATETSRVEVIGGEIDVAECIVTIALGNYERKKTLLIYSEGKIKVFRWKGSGIILENRVKWNFVTAGEDFRIPL